MLDKVPSIKNSGPRTCSDFGHQSTPMVNQRPIVGARPYSLAHSFILVQGPSTDGGAMGG